MIDFWRVELGSAEEIMPMRFLKRVKLGGVDFEHNLIPTTLFTPHIFPAMTELSYRLCHFPDGRTIQTAQLAAIAPQIRHLFLGPNTVDLSSFLAHCSRLLTLSYDGWTVFPQERTPDCPECLHAIRLVFHGTSRDKLVVLSSVLDLAERFGLIGLDTTISLPTETKDSISVREDLMKLLGNEQYKVEYKDGALEKVLVGKVDDWKLCDWYEKIEASKARESERIGIW